MAGRSGKDELRVSEKDRKLFLGKLNPMTEEGGLHEHFSQYGDIVDVVVMRYMPGGISRGFGFVTFATCEEATRSLSAGPHCVDGTVIDAKRATPRDQMPPPKQEPGQFGQGQRNGSSLCKLFVGSLDFKTSDASLRAHFEQFGTLTDCIVMKFRDTQRSRGFGFVTYSSAEMVDAAQAARPHTIDGKKVETKRAAPREGAGPGGQDAVKKIFVGGLRDGFADADVKDYFSKFGNVLNVEQMRERESGKHRGFGFVEFDDYDAVDKIVLQSSHQFQGRRLDIKKAVSREEISRYNMVSSAYAGQAMTWNKQGEGVVFGYGGYEGWRRGGGRCAPNMVGDGAGFEGSGAAAGSKFDRAGLGGGGPGGKRPCGGVGTIFGGSWESVDSALCDGAVERSHRKGPLGFGYKSSFSGPDDLGAGGRGGAVRNELGGGIRMFPYGIAGTARGAKGGVGGRGGYGIG